MLDSPSIVKCNLSNDAPVGVDKVYEPLIVLSQPCIVIEIILFSTVYVNSEGNITSTVFSFSYMLYKPVRSSLKVNTSTLVISSKVSSLPHVPMSSGS